MDSNTIPDAASSRQVLIFNERLASPVFADQKPRPLLGRTSLPAVAYTPSPVDDTEIPYNFRAQKKALQHLAGEPEPILLEPGRNSLGARASKLAGAARVGLSTTLISPQQNYQHSKPLVETDAGLVPQEPDAAYGIGHGRKGVKSHYVEVARGGHAMKVVGYRMTGNRATGGRRGKISGFSRSSRRKMMWWFQSIDQQGLAVKLPLFITLTYSAAFPTNPEHYKRHLDTFLKALLRKKGHERCFAIWRLEFQARGAPHYHIVLFNVRYLDFRWVAETWNRIVSASPADCDFPQVLTEPEWRLWQECCAAHLKGGTEVRRVNSWGHASAYVTKYVSKVEQFELAAGGIVPAHVGRYWGIVNRQNMPLRIYRERVPHFAFVFLRRQMRRYLDRRGYWLRNSRSAGASAFINGDVAMRLIEYLGCTPAAVDFDSFQSCFLALG